MACRITKPKDPAAAAGDDKKPHPNSTEAKAAKKLADDLADARHVLRRSGKDMAEVDKLTDGGILMLAEQQRAIDRLAGEKGSQRKDADPRTPRPADPAARSTKGTGEGSDDLLPPDPADDDPLADPSPKPQTAGLPASLRTHLEELNETDPELAKTSRGLFRAVREHYQAESKAAKQEVTELETDLKGALDLLAKARLDLAFRDLAKDYPQLAEPEAQDAMTKAYRQRWDPDFTKVLGDPKLLTDDLKALAFLSYGNGKATHEPDSQNSRGQPATPGTTGRGGPQTNLSKRDALLESARIQARTDLSDAQKQAEIARLKSRVV